MHNALRNKDIEVIKYVLSIDGIQLYDDVLVLAINFYSTFDIVVHLLNVYLCQSIPSHLHNQFHIFQFSNHLHLDINNRLQKNDKNNKYEEELIEFKSKEIKKRERGVLNDWFIYHNKRRKLSQNNKTEPEIKNNNDNNNNDFYLKVVEENFKKIMNIKSFSGNRIWHNVCSNKNLDVVQLIFSLKGVQVELLNDFGNNSFLLACERNSNIKVIKYIQKLFPSFIHSQINDKNAAYFILFGQLERSEKNKLYILHYFYLNGIDIHHLIKKKHSENYDNIFTQNYIFFDQVIHRYLIVISQDFDYQNNEHDDKAYRKPSFWKEILHNNNNNNNNDNIANEMGDVDEQSKRVNEWKNRFEEHAIQHLSKMIQEWMLIDLINKKK